MSRSTLLVIIAVLLFPAVATAATPPRATPAHAERNVLHAVRVLTRWHVGLTDRRTGLLPANTTARCAGRGKSRYGAFTSLYCVIQRKTLRVRVIYVVLRHNGFELRKHRVVHS